MKTYPDMNIRFPEDREADLIEQLKSRAQAPWRWQGVPQSSLHKDYLFLERDAVGADPPCLLAIFPRKPGHWVVVNIVPHTESTGRLFRLSVEQYVGILQDFDRRIAEPAAEAVGGMTSIDTHERTLADYFPAHSIELLESFCTSSNKSTLGTHPSDRLKWIHFLLDVYRSGTNVSPDLFGALLEAQGWWPKRGIRKLVDEYELVMELLQVADGTMKFGTWTGTT